MRAATVTAVMGDGECGGVGRVVRSEIVVSRMSEGEITLRTNSAVWSATLDAANMVVVSSVVTVMPWNLERKMRSEKEGKEEIRKEGNKGKVQDEPRPGNADA
jgi:hypothetical protein